MWKFSGDGFGGLLFHLLENNSTKTGLEIIWFCHQFCLECETLFKIDKTLQLCGAVALTDSVLYFQVTGATETEATGERGAGKTGADSTREAAARHGQRDGQHQAEVCSNNARLNGASQHRLTGLNYKATMDT